jgi:Fur family zinc uptake transcriptional regulator
MQKPFPPADHDHDACATKALVAAENAAAARGVRFTALRHYVLEMLLASHKPVGAYSVLGALACEDSPARPAPPTVYRALDFLLEQGFVHRIASLNAYVACFSPARRHRAYFLICQACGQAGEMTDHNLEDALDAAAGDFVVQRECVELTGLCTQCSATPNRNKDDKIKNRLNPDHA